MPAQPTSVQIRAYQVGFGDCFLVSFVYAKDSRHVLIDFGTTELPNGAIELTRMLLDAGADPNIRDDKYGGTALGWAEFCGQPQIAELLRQRGATT